MQITEAARDESEEIVIGDDADRRGSAAGSSESTSIMTMFCDIALGLLDSAARRELKKETAGAANLAMPQYASVALLVETRNGGKRPRHAPNPAALA